MVFSAFIAIYAVGLKQTFLMIKMLFFSLPSFPNLNKPQLTALWKGNPRRRNGVCLLKLLNRVTFVEMRSF